MAKSNQMIKELDDMFGSKVTIDSFLDGKKRELKLVTLENFKEFMENIMVINAENMWTNFLTDEGLTAIKKILELSFEGYDIDELANNINANNFPIIFNTILKSNGINLDKEEGASGEGK